MTALPVFASCSDGQLIDFDSDTAEQEAPAGMSLDFPADHRICWDPRNADGTYASHAAIFFSYPGRDGKYCFGTLYLRSDGGDPLQEDVLYTATAVGTGLHIESAASDSSPHALLTYTPAHGTRIDNISLPARAAGRLMGFLGIQNSRLETKSSRAVLSTIR